jgi:CubicO group peptidase (beta-lactamase class C family)
MIYGIALAGGKVPPPEAKLYDQFPEYADLVHQPGRDRITFAQVLSMTLGTEWDELTIPYGDPRNSAMAMELSLDRYRFVLDRPIVGEPGVIWIYNGGATALLGRLITKGTGVKLPDYALRVLFDPLGLGPTEWPNGLQGEAHAASGLRMRAPPFCALARWCSPAVLGRVGRLYHRPGCGSRRAGSAHRRPLPLRLALVLRRGPRCRSDPY